MFTESIAGDWRNESMAKAKPKQVVVDSGVIDPSLVYSLAAAARAMGVSVRWVMDNLINNDAIPYRRQGDYKGIPEWVLRDWVEADLRRRSEWLAEIGRRKQSNPRG
jgi:hypothetical protein